MSRNEDILRAIIYGGSAGERAAESRNEAILLAMLDVLNGEEVDLSHLPAPQSRFESLLLQVVRKLEEGGSGGGGGGGTVDSSYCIAKYPASVTTFNDTTIKWPEELIVPNTISVFGTGICTSRSEIKKLIMQSPLAEIANGACYQATNLSYVYIPASVTKIGSAAFVDVGGIIDCGFAEGAVSGAPWGATNATIRYNVPEPTV